jgi:hypothetical protein
MKCSVRTAPGKSWNLIFKFSRPWKKDLSPGNPWNFYTVHLEFFRFSNVHTLTVKFIKLCMNDHFSCFLSLGHDFLELNTVIFNLQIFLGAQIRCCVTCDLFIYYGARFRDLQ